MASGVFNHAKAIILNTMELESMMAFNKGTGKKKLLSNEMIKKAKAAAKAFEEANWDELFGGDDDDEELRCQLDDIDASEAQVNKWEADFIESVLSQDRPLSPKQKAVINRMIEEYL